MPTGYTHPPYPPAGAPTAAPGGGGPPNGPLRRKWFWPRVRKLIGLGLVLSVGAYEYSKASYEDSLTKGGHPFGMPGRVIGNTLSDAFTVHSRIKHWAGGLYANMTGKAAPLPDLSDYVVYCVPPSLMHEGWATAPRGSKIAAYKQAAEHEIYLIARGSAIAGNPMYSDELYGRSDLVVHIRDVYNSFTPGEKPAAPLTNIRTVTPGSTRNCPAGFTAYARSTGDDPKIIPVP